MNRKFLMGLGLVSLISSNLFAIEVNDIKKDMFVILKTDDFKNVKVDLNLLSYKTGYENIDNTSYLNIKTTDFNSVGIGVMNIMDIEYQKSNYRVQYGLDFETYNNKNQYEEFKLYAGYISNNYPILGEKVSLYTGIELISNNKENNFNKVYTNYRFGTFINNKIYMGYKVKDTEKGMENLIQVQYIF